ncbi:gliding motility-associated C-terminal domain-containing protein [Aquimarina agarivorans]|uniref:gliding motility-associated C-terminal domain-containing protein n=1 Tax=Aquimarina agarivorans TaxID=980584 RepID=UPI000248EA98|nr:gliding motility-associated C-terminal domain-containing protein [Aquimarina agarivorans]
MNFIKKNLLFFLTFYFSFSTYGQCNVEETITICNMESIDFDSDGDPDGIINLNDEYVRQTGTTLESGTWSIGARFRIALDEASGNVSLWALQSATTDENATDYRFELSTASCGTDVAATVTIVLGPFSGVPISSFVVEACDRDPYDLFETLASNQTTPPPHLNGQWTYNGSSASFLGFVEEGSSEFIAKIPYQSGLPLVDQEVFDFTYTVTSSATCQMVSSTNVSVSVVRQVSAGFAFDTPVCESQILNGEFDSEIDLRDDQYLIAEDQEGIWRQDQDPTGEIEDELDSFIDLKRIYEERVINDGPRFGHRDFEFAYTVEQRSGVCRDSTARVSFTFFESLRPFSQSTTNSSFCLNDNAQSSVNLLDLIEFANEDGTDFIYDNISVHTTWSQLSGPESIDIQPEIGTAGIVNFRKEGATGNSPSAFISPGEYVFRYSVDPWINAPDIRVACLDGTTTRVNTCVNPCQPQSAEITISMLPFEYAGIGTSGLEFCESDDPVNLRSLLETSNPSDSISTTGVWTDNEGNVVANEFVFTEIDADQNLTLTYTTTHPTSGCVDTATLSFTINDRDSLGGAGESVAINVCSNNKNLNLFDKLGGSPDDVGSWSGPDDFSSSEHDFEFQFNNADLPKLQAGVYTYTVGGATNCELVNEATVTVQFVDPVTFSAPIMRFFCKNDGNIDLLTVIESALPNDGTFIDTDASGALDGSTLNVDALIGGIYNFEYVFDNSPCDSPVRELIIEIIDDVTPPTAGIGPDEPIRVCSSNLTINLFDQLTGNPSMSGRWNGPFSYESDNFLGEFDKDNIELPILGPGVYTYTVGGRGECGIPTQVQSRVQIEIVDPISIGEDVNASFCKLDGRVNLFTLLDEDTTRTGAFVDIDNTNALDADGNLEFATLDSGIYNFQYAVTNAAPCDVSSLNVEIDLVSLPVPVVANPTFCILDGKRLEDIPVTIFDKDGNIIDALNLNWYATSETSEKIVNNPKLFDGDVFYLANGGVAINDQECESERVAVTVTILNVGETAQNGAIICPLDLQDGVSPNGDNQNDTFKLVQMGALVNGKQFNIPEAFPDFNLEIYNRYGVKVYKGEINTPEFNGTSNQSLSIGSDLPTGVYFYIFSPNFKNNAPIQGSFYLSK